MSVWALIPTYNERDNVREIVPRLFAAVPDLRVLIVDDSSPDGTAEAVRSIQTVSPRLELLIRDTDRGFGQAYRFGLRHILAHTDASAIVTMDADLSHDPAHIAAMLDRLRTCDAVIGSRYINGGTVDGWSFRRRLLSRAGNAYVRAVTRMPFRDCSSGFNLVRAEALHSVNPGSLRFSGYAFLMELKYRLWRAGAKIEEVPIRFHERMHGESKISGRIIREGLCAPWLVRFQRR